MLAPSVGSGRSERAQIEPGRISVRARTIGNRGATSIWHWHVWTRAGCLLDGLLTVGVVDKTGRCERGIPRHRSAEMIHVWLVDHLDGPFATNMTIPPAKFRELAARRRTERGAPW